MRFGRINLVNGTAAGAILAVGMKEREHMKTKIEDLVPEFIEILHRYHIVTAYHGNYKIASSTNEIQLAEKVLAYLRHEASNMERKIASAVW